MYHIVWDKLSSQTVFLVGFDDVKPWKCSFDCFIWRKSNSNNKTELDIGVLQLYNIIIYWSIDIISINIAGKNM